MVDKYKALERLSRLRADGVLSDDEFAAEKARLLAGDDRRESVNSAFQGQSASEAPMRSTDRESGKRPLADRLADLFEQLHPLLAANAVEFEAEAAIARPSIVEARLRALFAQLAAPLEQSRRDGNLADVWSIAGIGRNEVRTAAVLAALWNPRICGAIATDFLTAFLTRLPGLDLPTNAELQSGYLIRTEDRPLGEASERVDVVIDGADFLLGVEIKIAAPEGHEQLLRYRNALQARAMMKRQRPALIYLSPKPPIDAFATHAVWRDVAAAARGVIPRKAADRAFVHRLIAQFATHVSTF